jgi:hypothetical protein
MINRFTLVFLMAILLIGSIACGQTAIGKAVGDSGNWDSATETSRAEDSIPEPTIEISANAKTEVKTLADVSEAPVGVFNRLWSDPPTLDPHLTSAKVFTSVFAFALISIVGSGIESSALEVSVAESEFPESPTAFPMAV